MLTRFVRNQLIIFTIASIIGVAVMLFAYMQVPTLLGVGRLTVTLELPATGGLYRFGNVTYRGVQIGKVTDGDAHRERRRSDAVAQHLAEDPRRPARPTCSACRRSASSTSICGRAPTPGRTCRTARVIAVANTTIPQPVGPMLDQVSTLVDSIPEDRISDLLDESFKAFNGAGPDFGSLIDSGATLTERPQRRLRPDARADRRQWAAAGFAGRDHRLDPDVGAQPRRASPGSSRRTIRRFARSWNADPASRRRFRRC